MARDYYQILGIDRKASADEVSKAFKKLARQYHPDVNQGNKAAEEKFKEASEAYEVLSSVEKRKKYDAYGSAAFDGGASSQSGPYGNPFSGAGGGFSSDDLGDIFGDLFSGMNVNQSGRRRRSTGFGARGARPTPPQRGRDLVFSIELDFLEAANGSEKTIRLPNGTSFKVKIPAGVHEGGKIRLSGKGEPGHYGGESGDLLIEPKILPHPFFRRKDFDIEINLPIRIREAIEGAKVRVPTISGTVDLKLAAGSQSGQKLRLKEKGVYNAKTKKFGDQYVVLHVMMPQHLAADQKEQLLKLLESMEDDPRKDLWPSASSGE